MYYTYILGGNTVAPQCVKVTAHQT